MSDERYRRLFRAGLAPLVEDVPEGPVWDELEDGEIVTARPSVRRTSGWLVGLAAAVVVVVLVGVAVFLAPAGPPPTTGPAATTTPTSQVFDVDTAASEVETWWSLVIAGDLTAAVDMAHPDGDFNFGGLVDLVAGLGGDVSVSMDRNVFGTENQPMLCYTLEGSNGEETGAAVFREHEQRWMLWEMRPNTVGCLNTTTTTAPVSTTTVFTSEAWDLVADHPVVGRVFPVVVWTGSEVVVWGGEKPSEGAWHADGAAWNPDTGVWRDLAESPLSARSEHAAVWTGSEVLICCGRIEGGGVAAAAYDPEADQWREIASPPISPAFAEAVWTGEEMVVFGGVGGGGTATLTGAVAYDPAADSWRELADLPYPIERNADSVLADGLIYVWPSPVTFEDDPEPLAYDIRADQWSPLPERPPEAPAIASLAWTGQQLFAYGASENASGAFGVAVLYDPAEGSWSVVEPAPLEPTDDYEGTDGSEAVAWGDDQVYIWTGHIGTDPSEPYTNVITYAPETSEWQILDPSPIPAQGMWHNPIIWTGNQLIAYSDPMAVLNR